MKNFFKQLFSDDNQINEKSFIGFLAFCVMVLCMVVDLVTGWMGKPLLINEFVFNAFMYLTLGAFGIGSIDKFINKIIIISLCIGSIIFCFIIV